MRFAQSKVQQDERPLLICRGEQEGIARSLLVACVAGPGYRTMGDGAERLRGFQFYRLVKMRFVF